MNLKKKLRGMFMGLLSVATAYNTAINLGIDHPISNPIYLFTIILLAVLSSLLFGDN